MAEPLRLCLCQTASPAGDTEIALQAVAQGLAVATSADADLVLFPELLFPGYNAAGIPAMAQPVDGPWAERVGRLARAAGIAVVYGYAERAGDRVFNAALAIGPDGAVLASYRKIQLYGAREARLFVPGRDYALFTFRGRRCALLICYDVEFAPHVAAVAAAGAELVLVPTANMQPFTHVSRLTVPSQAVNQGVAIAYANYAGVEGDLAYCGGSLVVAADGTVLAMAGPVEATLVVDLVAGDPSLLSTQRADYRAVG